MLERMGDFFDTRLRDYEAHQLTCIDSAQEFYPFTANCLPQAPVRVYWIWGAARAWSSDTILKPSPRPESWALTSRQACLTHFAASSMANP